ncbi:MAG: hypothetical protein EOO72_03540 [Myxococcaceae bacterium]|nr:MAG: hypothetical protein EOO72_03540 [Myxococcaceae bacterium]
MENSARGGCWLLPRQATVRGPGSMMSALRPAASFVRGLRSGCVASYVPSAPSCCWNSYQAAFLFATWTVHSMSTTPSTPGWMRLPGAVGLEGSNVWIWNRAACRRMPPCTSRKRVTSPPVRSWGSPLAVSGPR